MHRAPKASQAQTRGQAHRRVVERSRRRGLTGFLYQWKRNYCIGVKALISAPLFLPRPSAFWTRLVFLVALPIQKSPAQTPGFSKSGRVGSAAIDYSMTCTIRCVRGSTSTVRSLTTVSVSYTHLRAHETDSYLVCRLL